LGCDGSIYIKKSEVTGIYAAGYHVYLSTTTGTHTVMGTPEENKAIYDGVAIESQYFTEKSDGILFRKFDA